jgi:GTPase SAR1 family protein
MNIGSARKLVARKREVSIIISTIKDLLDYVAHRSKKVLFFGPSGCGKSLFLRAINGEGYVRDPKGWTAIQLDTPDILKGDVFKNVERKFDGIETVPKFGVDITQIIIDDLDIFLGDLETDPKAYRYALARIRALHDVLLTAAVKNPNILKREILDLFDEYLPIFYPSLEDRFDILKLYLSNFEPRIEAYQQILQTIASKTKWFSGSELAELVGDVMSNNSGIKESYFELTIDQIAGRFSFDNRRRELEEYLNFTLGNSKVPSIFLVHAKQVCYEFGIIHQESLPYLIDRPEDEHLEFKAVFCNLIDDCLQDIDSFLNTDGGILFIGVSDEKPRKILGLNLDHKVLKHKNSDGFAGRLISTFKSRFGEEYLNLIEISFQQTNNGEICKVKVQKSTAGVFLKKADKSDDDFYVRKDGHSLPLSRSQTYKYIKEHFKEKTIRSDSKTNLNEKVKHSKRILLTRSDYQGLDNWCKSTLMDNLLLHYSERLETLCLMKHFETGYHDKLWVPLMEYKDLKEKYGFLKIPILTSQPQPKLAKKVPTKEEENRLPKLEQQFLQALDEVIFGVQNEIPLKGHVIFVQCEMKSARKRTNGLDPI